MPKIIYALFIAITILGILLIFLVAVEELDWAPSKRNQAFIDTIIESANQNDSIVKLGDIAPHDFDNICIIYDYMSVKRGLAYSGVKVDRVEPKNYSYSESDFGIAYVKGRQATAYYINRKLSAYVSGKGRNTENQNVTKSCNSNLALELVNNNRHRDYGVIAFVEKPKSP